MVLCIITDIQIDVLESVDMGKMFEFVCLEHNSKTKDPKVFKLGIRNDLEIF